jgi:NADH-quinone oxidoreductase subunit A
VLGYWQITLPNPRGDGPLNEFLNVIIMLIVAGGIGVLALIVGAVLGPKKPSRTKLMAYESGNDPIGTARERFPIHFYLVAMLFIVFDIETAFFYPLAVAYGELGTYVFWEALVFVALLGVGYFYILKKGVLEWK